MPIFKGVALFFLFLVMVLPGWSKDLPVHKPEQNSDYIFVLTAPGSSLMSVKNWVQEQGFKVTLLAPPNGLIAKSRGLSSKVLSGSFEIQKIYQNQISKAEMFQQSYTVVSLMKFFNELISGEAQKSLEAAGSSVETQPQKMLPDAFPSPQIDYQSFLLNLQQKNVQKDRFKKGWQNLEPMTAGDLGNSEVMIGTVALTIFFVESNGTGPDPNTYTWTTTNRDTVLSKVMQGLNWWVAQADTHNQQVSFLINYYAPTDPRCQTGYEPILHKSSEVALWIDPIMTNFGYTYGDIFTKVAAFNSWQIDTFETDWAYSAFYEYNPSPAPSAFTDGYSAFAYFGGPFTNLLFRSFGWAVNQVFTHESGHIFYACDEYYQAGYGGCTSCNPCNSRSHNTLNGNCEHVSCNPASVSCMMKNNAFSLCAYTPGQIGWELYNPSVPVLLLAPSWSDMVADSGSVFDKNLRVRNIGDDTTTLTISDIQSDQSWLTLTPPGSFPHNIAGGDSLDYTLTFNLSALLAGGYYDANLVVTSNDSGQTDVKDTIPISLFIKCNSIDEGGYLFSDLKVDPWLSTQFRDINQSGNKIPNNSFYNTYIPGGKLDDGTAGPISLGFNFNYYGQTYSDIFVAINGGVSFTKTELNAQGYFTPIDILTPEPPLHPYFDAQFIPVFWNDLWIRDSVAMVGRGAIYTYSNTVSNPAAPDTFIVEWYHIANFNAASDTFTTFELIFSNDKTGNGNIALLYKHVGTTGLGTSSTIGIFDLNCDGYPIYDGNTPATRFGTAPVNTSGTVTYKPGDADRDNKVNLADIMYLVNYVFKGGAGPKPGDAGDSNCDDNLNLPDITYLVNYVFKGGPPPCIP